MILRSGDAQLKRRLGADPSRVKQGDHEDRGVFDTLDLGWRLLATLPKAELKRIRPEYLEAFLPRFLEKLDGE